MLPSANGTRRVGRGGYRFAKSRVAQAVKTIRTATINRQLTTKSGGRPRFNVRGGMIQRRTIPATGLISASKRELINRIINSRQHQFGNKNTRTIRTRPSFRGQRSFRRFSAQNGGLRTFTPKFSVPFKRVQYSNNNNRDNSVDHEYLMQARALIQAQSEKRPFVSNRGFRSRNAGFRRGRFQQRRPNNNRFYNFDSYRGFKPRGGRRNFKYSNGGYFNARSMINW